MIEMVQGAYVFRVLEGDLEKNINRSIADPSIFPHTLSSAIFIHSHRNPNEELEQHKIYM